MFNIVLFNPEIPPNTGNIIRLCANCGSTLHLVHPLGFDLEEKSLRRAGLDYHELARVVEHRDYAAFLRDQAPDRLFAFSTSGTMPYSGVAYEQGDYLLFGSETRGLPNKIRDTIPVSRMLTIPMQPQSRSLNLSNAVAVVAYEAWRQLEFACG